ncbi:MAG TPA: DUF4230 domain-containing protein [Chloroflexia bacterium]|nr:DUF4230 domain-containing protein [Chloroflexia bacterium]
MAKTHSRSVSALNRLIFLAILIPLAIIAVSYFLSANNPFATKINPAPILIGQIQKQYKMETAEVTSSTVIEGLTQSALPFSQEKYDYQVVVTMTAGIDMSNIKDSDITVSGDTVTVKLPAPQLLRTETSGQVISHDRQMLSGFSENKNLLDQIQAEGKNRVVKTVLEQGKLMQEARTNAEDNLRNLILQLGYKNVVFVQSPDTTPTPDVTGGPPR